MKKLASKVSAILISVVLAFSAVPAAFADGGASGGLAAATSSLGARTVQVQSLSTCSKKPTSTYFTGSFSGRYSMKLTWNKVYSADGYQIQYSTSPSFRKGQTYKRKYSWNINGGTLYKSSRYRTYYVRIRTYKKTGGKNYYSRWSSTRTMVTNNWTRPVRSFTAALVLARHQVCSQGKWCPSGYRILHCGRYHQYQVYLKSGNYRYYYYVVKETGAIYEVRNGYWYYMGSA